MRYERLRRCAADRRHARHRPGCSARARTRIADRRGHAQRGHARGRPAQPRQLRHRLSAGHAAALPRRDHRLSGIACAAAPSIVGHRAQPRTRRQERRQTAERGIGVITVAENRWPRVDIKSRRAAAERAGQAAGAERAPRGVVRRCARLRSRRPKASSSNAWIVTRTADRSALTPEHGFRRHHPRGAASTSAAQAEERALRRRGRRPRELRDGCQPDRDAGGQDRSAADSATARPGHVAYGCARNFISLQPCYPESLIRHRRGEPACLKTSACHLIAHAGPRRGISGTHGSRVDAPKRAGPAQEKRAKNAG